MRGRAVLVSVDLLVKLTARPLTVSVKLATGYLLVGAPPPATPVLADVGIELGDIQVAPQKKQESAASGLLGADYCITYGLVAVIKPGVAPMKVFTA
jgi:hypothetical protein